VLWGVYEQQGNTMLTSAVLPPLTRSIGLPDWTAGAICSLSAAVWVVTAPYWGAYTG